VGQGLSPGAPIRRQGKPRSRSKQIAEIVCARRSAKRPGGESKIVEVTWCGNRCLRHSTKLASSCNPHHRGLRSSRGPGGRRFRLTGGRSRLTPQTGRVLQPLGPFTRLKYLEEVTLGDSRVPGRPRTYSCPAATNALYLGPASGAASCAPYVGANSVAIVPLLSTDKVEMGCPVRVNGLAAYSACTGRTPSGATIWMIPSLDVTG
jgi:hypothetical protein